MTVRSIVRWLLWKVSGPQPVFTNPPATRTYILRSDNRTFVLEAEGRTFVVPREDRTYIVPVEED